MEKRIVVKEENREKIEQWIKEVEGRSTERKISYETIVEDISRLEKKLHIPKTYMTGIIVYIDSNAQNFPNAYHYCPMSTQYVIKKTSSGWVLTEIYRAACKNPNNYYNLVLTDKAKEALVCSVQKMDHCEW